MELFIKDNKISTIYMFFSFTYLFFVGSLTKMGSNGVIDLEEIVVARAWTIYKRNRKRWQPKHLDDVDLVFDWNRVSFVVEKPKFSEKTTIEQPKFASNVIFKSVFENKSKIAQTHSLKAERQTVATCKSSLTKGFTRGLSVGLTFTAPQNIINASVGYSEGFSVTSVKETTDQKTLTWATEGTLTVPAESTLTAELQIIEEQSDYIFTTRVAIRGTVIVNIYKRKNNKFLKVYTGDMESILTQTDSLRDLKTEGRTVYLDVEGECNFKFGIEQQIVIS